ncbi:hypothetical protein NC653_005328 [Populus alba x Populus x berolinensis]|uniref:Uncharacterized protein n=1 Tax=Populus alba x Populus x berolinensis TaxID=444605 RepID=A0AAD6RC20_9ROSI|nr:hypothetical protein NC653_005328 [Populus alba x Populus x berolinensis]
MTGRIFLVIFFFWALLAIVTPTLVLLSEFSKPYLDLNDVAVEKKGGVLKPRRMMGYLEKQPRIEEIALASILQAPTPAPEPEPVSGIREAILTRMVFFGNLLAINTQQSYFFTVHPPKLKREFSIPKAAIRPSQL